MLCSRSLLGIFHMWIWPSGAGTFLMDILSHSNFQLHRSALGCRRNWWAVVHPGPLGNNTQQSNLHWVGQVHNPDSIYQRYRAGRMNHWCCLCDLKIEVNNYVKAVSLNPYLNCFNHAIKNLFHLPSK